MNRLWLYYVDNLCDDGDVTGKLWSRQGLAVDVDCNRTTTMTTTLSLAGGCDVHVGGSKRSLRRWRTVFICRSKTLRGEARRPDGKTLKSCVKARGSSGEGRRTGGEGRRVGRESLGWRRRRRSDQIRAGDEADRWPCRDGFRGVGCCHLWWRGDNVESCVVLNTTHVCRSRYSPRHTAFTVTLPHVAAHRAAAVCRDLRNTGCA